MTGWLAGWLSGWLAIWLTDWPTDLLADLLSPWNWLRLETVLLLQLVKKLPAVYGARRCVTVFTRARRLSLSRGKWFQSTLSHPTCLRSILILSSHLPISLHSGHLPSGFLPKRCIYFSSHMVRNILVKCGECLYTLQFPILYRSSRLDYVKTGKERGTNYVKTPRSWYTLFCLAICYFICSTVSRTFVRNSKSSA